MLTMFCTRSVSNVIKSSFFAKPFAFTRTMSMLVENVKFASENAKGECPAVFVKGKDSSSTRGLIVLQEWWGLNQQIQDEAKEIAEKGDFLALVPDLYRGELATDNEAAGHLMNNLDWPGAVQDIAGIITVSGQYMVINVGVLERWCFLCWNVLTPCIAWQLKFL